MSEQVKEKAYLDALLVNAVTHSTQQVLTTMCGLSVGLVDVSGAVDFEPKGDVSAIIGITGKKGEGMFSISFPKDVATLIISKLLSIELDQLSLPDMLDGVGEMVNMISGNTKTALATSTNEHYQLSLPTVISGANHHISSSSKYSPYLILEFKLQDCPEISGDSFFLYISYQSDNSPRNKKVA